MWLSRGLLIFLIPLIAFSCVPKAKIPIPEKPPEPPVLEKVPELAEEKPEEEPPDVALFNMGELLFSKEDFSNAGLTFRDLIEQYPASPLANEAKYKLGICYAKTGRYEDSLELLREALPHSLSPLRKSMIYSMMAENYSGLGDHFEALRWYAKAMESTEEEAQKGEMWQSIKEIVDHRLSPGQLQEVQFIYQGSPISGYAAFKIAQISFDEGDVPRSKKLIYRIMEEFQNQPYYPQVKAFFDRIKEESIPERNVIGCILPLSGENRVYGIRSLHGIELAIHAFEPNYGGMPIKLVIRDSKSSPGEAATAVEDLVDEERVMAIIGPLLSATSEAAAKRAQELEVPIITLTQREYMAEIGDFVFQNCLTNSQQIKALASYAMEQMGLSRFAILYPRDLYGITLTHLFIDEVLRNWGEVMGVQSYDNEQMDFGRQIKQLVGLQEAKVQKEGGRKKDFEPIIEFDGLFIPDYSDRIGLIAPQLAYYNVIGITLLGTSAWNSLQLVSEGGKYVDESIFVDGFFKDSQNPRIKRFTGEFRNTFESDPTILEAQAYDAMDLCVQVLTNQEIYSHRQMRDGLMGVMVFDGVSGLTSFDAEGKPNKIPFMLTVKKGKIQQIE
ncbi:MAG: penicillin-binding protein activator [Syntrophobacterales bacterium]|nr:MAG: penicillin-binding protein activator [Syntrophobacterales bacterium]